MSLSKICSLSLKNVTGNMMYVELPFTMEGLEMMRRLIAIWKEMAYPTKQVIEEDYQI